MATSVQKNLQEKNADYASTFKEGHLALPPAKKYLVGKLLHQSSEVPSNPQLVNLSPDHLEADPCPNPVTCMDARIDPAAAFGINLGDAHVIRNAGGNAKDALRSIIISQQLLGTNEVLLVKHTGCGMLTFKNEDAHGVVKKNLGEEAAGEIAGLDFQPFPELEKAVEDDVKLLRGSKAVPDTVTLSGWVYEVESGKVRQVV